MADKIVELISYEGNSFRGIDKSSKVFIDFTQRKKWQGYTELSGKQGTKKTSTLTGVAYAIGARFSLDTKQLINRIDGEIDEAVVLKVDGEKYRIETDTKRVSVKKSLGDDKWSTKGVEQTPTDFMEDVLGKVIFIPTDVQFAEGKKQILFIQKMFGSGEDAGKKMAQLEVNIKKVFDERKDFNREVKSLSTALETEPLYQEYEKSQVRFKVPVSADKEKKKYDELAEKKTGYEKYQNTFNIAEAELQDKVNKIADLEKQLAAAKADKVKLQESVDKGRTWLDSNKGILKEFDVANQEWLNLSKKLADYEKWKNILGREKELVSKQELASGKDAELAQLREDLLKLTKKYLPKVAGLSIKVAAGLDTTEAKEGAFYQVPGKKEEQPWHELSESEYEDMWLLILEAVDAKFVFIENMNRFGTNVVETLNRFVKNGGNVFYTIMDREKDEMELTFKAKI